MNATNNSNIPAEQDILDGLAVNLKLSQDLLAALQEESTALRGMDTQNLFRISRQKDTLLAKIQYLDNSLRTSLATDNKSAPAPKLTPEQLRTVGQYKTRINTMRQEIISKKKEGLSNSEIARLVDRSPSSIRNILRAAGYPAEQGIIAIRRARKEAPNG